MTMISEKLRLTSRLSRLALAVAIALPAQFAVLSPSAAQNRLSIVRDAEIEALVREYAKPILNAAGLSKSGIEIILVNDPSFNAFVAGRRMFINTGALMTAESPNEIIGVLAHEAGHIAGGHQQRLRDQLARAQTMAIVAGLLGVGATVAGAASGNDNLGRAGAGIAMGGGEMARRTVLSYQRTEETSADMAAVQYLDATGQSAKGMLKTFKRFADALSLTGSRVDPYQVSHPMPRDRIANLTERAEKSPSFGKSDSAALQLRHDLMRAKVAAHTGGQGATSRMFRGNPNPLPAKYGDAITTYLYGNPAAALKKVDALLKTQPQNPYFLELRGDVLMKANKPADAAATYAKAVKLDPSRSGVMQVSYGRALLAVGSDKAVDQAVKVLRAGIERDRENPSAYMPLSQAYGRLGDIGQAELAAAEGHYYSGSYLEAKVFAARAQQKLKRGSPGWVRAQDIINFKDPSKRRK